MPRWNGFGRSLVFAVVAAAGVPVATTFGAPLVGGAASVKLYLLAVAGVYVAGLGVERSRRVAAATLAALAGLVLACLPLGLAGTALGAAAIVAVGRSGIAWRQPGLRGPAVEGLLGGVGLGVAAFLATGGLLALCLAVWGYFLVQSAYFLIGGGAPRRDAPDRDPFERARARLERLLEDEMGAPR
jgi:hypothetical protein